MSDSSDEEISFEDEIIDLEALWRDRPFLTDYKCEKKVKILPAQPNGIGKPIVIELIPISEIVEESATSSIADLMNEFDAINREIANVSQATDDRNTNYANRLDTIRQRIRRLGGTIVEENNSSRPKWNTPRTSPDRTLPGTSNSFSAIVDDHPSTSRGSQQLSPNINRNGIPRWVPRRYQKPGDTGCSQSNK